MRRKERVGVEWGTPEAPHWTWQHVEIEVLMDIRAELHQLNQLLHCVNFVGIPSTLKSIRRAMPKRKVKAKA